MKSKHEVMQRTVEVLENRARRRETVTYKELSELVDGLPVRGTYMTEVLSKVSKWSWQQHRVLLPALVVNASGDRLPSDGFYDSLNVHRPDDVDGDRKTLALRERGRVHRAYPLS